MLSRQVTLFREVQSFRLLALATVGSAFGTWLAFVALTIDVYDRTGSAVWVSALLIADFLPAIVIGIAASSLVDRLPRRRLMIASDLARVAIFAVLPFANGPGVIVALAAARRLRDRVLPPGALRGAPEPAPRRGPSLRRTRCSRRSRTSPGLSAPSWEACSSPRRAPMPRTGSTAVTFLVSAALLAGIPDRLLQSAQAVGRGYWRDLTDGFKLVRDSRALLTVLAAWNVVMLATAGANVAEIVLAKETFDAGDFGYGLLVGVTGVGLALGSLLAGSQLEHRALATVYATSIGLVAVGMVGAAAAPNVWIAAVSVAVAGIGNGAAVVCNALLVQRGAPDELRGRAFTLLMSSNYLVLGSG